MALNCETPACKAQARYTLVMTLGSARVATRYCYRCCPNTHQVEEISAAVLAARPSSSFTASIQAAA